MIHSASRTPALYVAVTGHGFGHASRVAWVLREIRMRRPDIAITINSSVPRWFFQSIIGDDFDLRNVPLDTGIVQEDSLRMDLPATREAALRLEAGARKLIESEAEWICKMGAGLVLADIPPLAVDVGHAAGVPVYCMGNFGWDFIYQALGAGFEDLAAIYATRYSRADLLFRLPFSEPMAAFSRRLDVGLPGGRPRLDPEEVRKRLPLRGGEVVLLSFGGMGLSRIPYGNLKDFDGGRYPEMQFLTFDSGAPDLPNLIRIKDLSVFPIDVIPVCGRTVSKPGFGIFSDVLRSGGGLVCLEREGFAEAPILMEALERHFHHRIITVGDFYSDDWGFLAEGLTPPGESAPVSLDGNDRIAEAVIRALEGSAVDIRH